MAGRPVGPAERRRPLLDLRVRGVSLRSDPRHVALDVRDEHGNAGLRQLAGHELQGLGLARAGRSRDQAMAVQHRKGDLDANLGQHLRAKQGTAEDDRRLVECVARCHVVAESLVHRSPSGCGLQPVGS